MKQKFILLFFIGLIAASNAQEHGQGLVNSLLRELPLQKEDTNKVKLLSRIAKSYDNLQSNEKGILYGKQGLELAKKLGWKKGEAELYRIIGNNYSSLADSTALTYYQKAIGIEKEIGNKKGQADALYNTAIFFSDHNDYPKSAAYTQEALKIYKAIGYQRGVSYCLRSIGLDYHSQGNDIKALDYLLKALAISATLGDKPDIAANEGDVAVSYTGQGNYVKALEYNFRALKDNKALDDISGIARITGNIGIIYFLQDNYGKALEFYQRAIKIYEELGDQAGIAINTGNIGSIYQRQGQYNKAAGYYLKALKAYRELGNKGGIAANTGNLGLIYFNQGDNTKALDYFNKALEIYKELKEESGIALYTGNTGLVYLSLSQDSTFSVSERQQMLQMATEKMDTATKRMKTIGDLFSYKDFSRELSQAYTFSGNYEKALNAFKEYIIYRDSLYNTENAKEIARKELNYEYSRKQDSLTLENATKELALQKEMQEMQFKETLKRKEIENNYRQQQSFTEAEHRRKSALAEAEQEKKNALNQAELRRQRNMTYASFGGLGLLLIIVLLAAYAFRQRRKAEQSRLIEQQKTKLEKEVVKRTAELNQSLESLKATQRQLVHSEKMASLGELTAGIAHEIQNPLNFVNNFSDVSVELLEELNGEVRAGHTDDVLAIASDLKQNLEKIAHHGRRADNIVKGMLQHSRTSSGQKEPTDINALADEYLRLAYHGLRAKDKSFNAVLTTDYEESLPKINIIAQDIGRVLLNLFTNAFYATQQKKLGSATSGERGAAVFEPEVIVTTKSVGNSVEIIIKDNGTGIPDAIKDKILQPFFTTKPTGEGTGLGLSLSYDIIVKGHGGTISIESEEGRGSEFKVTLSIG